MRKLLLGFFWILLSAALVGCSNTQDSPNTEWWTPGSWDVEQWDVWPIKVWVIAPLAWWAAVYGEDATHAYNYIIDKVNADEWINGRQVELIYENGWCEGKEATSAAQKLINVDGVSVILWGVCSSETIPSGKISNDNWVVQVSALSSSPEISSIGDYVFRYWNDLDAGGVFADLLTEDWAENIALFVENNDYSINYANVVKDNFDWKILVEEKIDPAEKDLSIVAKKIADVADEADKIIFIAVTETLNSGIFTALDNEWILSDISTKLMWAEVFLVDSVLEAHWSKLDWVTTLVQSENLPWVDEILTDLTDWYEVKSADLFMVLLADSAAMIVDALTQVWEDSEAIKNYIAGFTEENPRKSLFGDFYFDAEWDGQGIAFTPKVAQWWVLVEAE